MSTDTARKESIHQAVQATYGELARRGGAAQEEAGCCAPECCTPQTADISDYKPEELSAVPKGAYLGAGSGTPVRHAALKPGEVVVDLGAGAGMDTFLAANAVGPSGRVHGFDLTVDMLERARRNAAEGGYTNVSFERSDIERLSLADGAADAAISNCVINLTPDKAAVYREIFRVLKSGGRLSVSDIVLRGPADAVAKFRQQGTPDTWCACVSGALEEQEYLGVIRGAGFVDVKLVSERAAQFQPGSAVQAVAVTINARKPA
jgi:SAM-dependent methyltransferase